MTSLCAHTCTHTESPDLVYISPRFGWPENLIFSELKGILSFNKFLLYKFQAFVLKNPQGVHMPFSRIMYVLSVQCPLSHLMTQMGLLIYLWIAGLPVLTESLQVL